MFTQENIGCYKTLFCDGLALNKSKNGKKALTKQSLLQKLCCASRKKNEVFVFSFCKDFNRSKCTTKRSFVKAFKQDVLSDEDTKRFALYHAAKCLVETLLLCHPKTPLFKLTEPKNNAASSNKALSRDLISGSEKSLFIETPINLETLLIGFYAGKVGEFFYSHTTQHTTQLKKRLFLTTKKRNTLFGVSITYNSKQSVATVLPFHAKIDQFSYQSDIGLSERVRATSLVKYILANGSIYSPNFLNLKTNSILGNLNKTEILERKIFALFQSLQEEMSTVYGKQRRHNQKNDKLIRNGSSTFNRLYKWEPFTTSEALATTNELESKKIDSISQNRETSGWCEEMVCKALTFYKKPYGHWFRIYLPQIETHQRQPASLDKFFTKSRQLKLLSETTSIASTYHSRRLQSFALLKGEQSTNKARLCLSLVHPLPCMKLSAKTKVSENTVCAFYQSKAITKHSFVKVSTFVKIKTSDLDEHSKTISTGLEARLQPYLSPTLNLKLSKLTHLKKAHFYTNFACNSNDIATQKFVTKAPFVFYLRPQEFGHGTDHNLILNTFSRAFRLIGKNRELLDILADHFIRFGKIRMPEILRICSLYVDMANFREQSSILSEGIEKTKQSKQAH